MNRLKLLAVSCIFFAACTSGQTSKERTMTSSSAAGSGFISNDSANKMISSYLNSISGSNDTNLHAIIFDADSLRLMLNNDTQGRITSLKIMLAHTLPYINSGGQGQNCGYKSGQLTLIIAGYGSNADYIFYPATQVLNNGMPCPTSCPTSGTASNDLLPN